MTELKDLLNRMLEEQIQTRKVLTRIEYHLLINAISHEVPDITDGEKLTTSLSDYAKEQLVNSRFNMKLLHDALSAANEDAIDKFHYHQIFSPSSLARDGYFMCERALGDTENGKELYKRITSGESIKYLELERHLMPLYGISHSTRLRQKLTSCANSEAKKGHYPKDSNVMKRILNFQKSRSGTGTRFPSSAKLTGNDLFSVICLFVLSLGFPPDPDKSYIVVDDF
jgi:hypothetical protein